MTSYLSGALLCALCVFAAGQQAPPLPTLPPAATDAPTVAAAVTAAVEIGDPSCADVKDCSSNSLGSCINQYTPYAKANCARWCGYCRHPDDLNKPCKDNIPNCSEYPTDLCTNDYYRIFVEQNCISFCKKCDFRARYLIALEDAGQTLAPITTPTPPPTLAPYPTDAACKDTDSDFCWAEPNENCFGQYEPWAHANCPFRCGFCAVKPACVDRILYCSQYGADACTNPQFFGFINKNCRATCNMCDLPVRPAGQAPYVPGGSPNVAPPSQGGNVAPGGATSGPGMSPGMPTGTPAMTSDAAMTSGPAAVTAGPTATAVPTAGVSAQTPIVPKGNFTLLGQQSTFVVEGEPYTKIPGVCFYGGKARLLNSFWYDGCDFKCNCFDAVRNRVICSSRCTTWGPLPASLNGCSLVKEVDACCLKLECNA